MIKHERLGWAIDWNYTDLDGKVYHEFIGLLYFTHDIPVYQDMRPCIFRTRKEAKAHVKEVSPEARVVRVKITIETVK